MIVKTQNCNFSKHFIYFTDDGLSLRYLLYKFIISLYLVIGCILNLKSYIDDGISKYYWIYLTHWSFFLLAFVYLYDTIFTFIRFALEQTESSQGVAYFVEKNHFSALILGPLMNTAHTVAIVITSVYWLILYDPDKIHTAMDKFNNLNIHLMQVRY